MNSNRKQNTRVHNGNTNNNSNSRFSMSPIQSALSPRALSFGEKSPASPANDSQHDNLSTRLEGIKL